MKLLTWWAPVMSHSHLMLPVCAWRILKHSLPIWMPLTRRAQYSVNALPSVSPFLWPRVDLLIAPCHTKTRERMYSKCWLLDFPVTCYQWEEGADSTSDMTQLESHTYWSLQSEFYPQRGFLPPLALLFFIHTLTWLPQIKITINNKLLADICIYFMIEDTSLIDTNMY